MRHHCLAGVRSACRAPSLVTGGCPSPASDLGRCGHPNGSGGHGETVRPTRSPAAGRSRSPSYAGNTSPMSKRVGLLTRRKLAKTESTLISDRGRIARHIIPLLGRMPVKTVRRGDIERFMHDVAAGKTATREKTKPRGLSIVRGGRGVAGRTVALLGAIFTYAVRQGLRPRQPGAWRSSSSPKAGDSDV